jgi:hypothetical protein
LLTESDVILQLQTGHRWNASIATDKSVDKVARTAAMRAVKS